jgi:hypothetical protein
MERATDFPARSIKGGTGCRDKAACSNARVPAVPRKGQVCCEVTRHGPLAATAGAWCMGTKSVGWNMGLC